MNISAIVLAAGNGKRMGADIPKQFLKINGEYILTKTLRVFQESSVISDIVLVTGEEWIDFCHDEIVGKEGFSKVRHIITGGKERYDSSYAGILQCPNSDYVFIHDAARPKAVYHGRDSYKDSRGGSETSCSGSGGAVEGYNQDRR